MWSTLLAFALAAPHLAHGLLRFPCAQLTVMRADPLINPNTVGAHLHQVVGGSNFDFNMPSSINMTAARCSSCQYTENFSNYWTPTMYFQNYATAPTNGSFTRVPQITGSGLNDNTGTPIGGMVVYYTQTTSQTTAFPQGFRMTAGDPMLRSYNASIPASPHIIFRCLESDEESGQETSGMPTTACVGGIRSQLQFPTCWDGKNLDSTNHQDHVVYAPGSSFYSYGSGCPSTHPVVVPQIYLETYWDTRQFNNIPGAFSNGKQPFVWSMGDPTGYGYHADYMMGWTGNALQQAMNSCTSFGGACSVLQTRTAQTQNDCALPPRVPEQVNGWIPALPGCQPVQPGPARATMPAACGAPTATLAANAVSFLKQNITGWQAVGCAPSSSLSGSSTNDAAGMSIEKCLNICAGKNQQFAGLSAGTTCTCSSSFSTSQVSSGYACDTVCPGDPNEFCGATNRVAVYNGGAVVSIPPSQTATPTPTATPPPTASPSPTSPGTVPQYGQCGGQNWSGGTVCVSPFTCHAQNSYYSQCL